MYFLKTRKKPFNHLEFDFGAPCCLCPCVVLHVSECPCAENMTSLSETQEESKHIFTKENDKNNSNAQ